MCVCVNFVCLIVTSAARTGAIGHSVSRRLGKFPPTPLVVNAILNHVIRLNVKNILVVWV